MNSIICSQIFEKYNFESYSEFYMMLGMARECYRRGMSIDVSGMRIVKDVTPNEMLDYFKYLVSIGAIIGEGLSKDMYGNISEPKLSLDTSCFCKLGLDKILLEKEDKYFWSYEWSIDSYRSMQGTLLVFSQLGNILLHIVGYYLVSKYLGDLKNKPLEIEILDRQKVASSFIYINLLSCSKTLNCFKDIILNIDFSSVKTDIDYSIFYNNGVVADRIKLWSYKEKLEFLKQEGMPVGGVYILWERSNVNASNPAGKIINSSIIILDDIINDYIAYTKVSLSKTQEELIDDYYDIPEDKRIYFKDILDFSVYERKSTKKLINLGIRNYMFEEDFFIDKIDSHAKVSKKITINGNSDYVELSNVDAIYWLLCQYNVKFNRDLYKDMYSPDKDLLWDLYN